MRSGAPARSSTPENARATIAAGQLARRYGLPYRASNASASNALDAQAAYESQMSLWSAVLGGAHLVYHGAGWMEGGLTASFREARPRRRDAADDGCHDGPLPEILASARSTRASPRSPTSRPGGTSSAPRIRSRATRRRSTSRSCRTAKLRELGGGRVRDGRGACNAGLAGRARATSNRLSIPMSPSASMRSWSVASASSGIARPLSILFVVTERAGGLTGERREVQAARASASPRSRCAGRDGAVRRGRGTECGQARLSGSYEPWATRRALARALLRGASPVPRAGARDLRGDADARSCSRRRGCASSEADPRIRPSTSSTIPTSSRVFRRASRRSRATRTRSRDSRALSRARIERAVCRRGDCDPATVRGGGRSSAEAWDGSHGRSVIEQFLALSRCPPQNRVAEKAIAGPRATTVV